MNPLEQTILNALGAGFEKQGEKEDRQTYLARLVRAANKIDDAAWKALGADAQKWINEGVDQIKAGTPITELGASTSTGSTEASAGAAASGGAAAKPAEAKEKKPKAPAEPKAPRKPAVTSIFRKLVIENPSKNVDDVLAMLKSQGHEISTSTAQAFYYDTHATLNILKELGKLPKDPEPAPEPRAA